MLGCVDESCPVSFEPQIFEVQFRANEDVFEHYSDRVEATSNIF